MLEIYSYSNIRQEHLLNLLFVENNIYLYYNNWLEEYLNHLLLGDEGEGEPLVASPPCAADSVQSVQREITSPPPI